MKLGAAYRSPGSSFRAENSGARSSTASFPPGLARARRRGMGDDEMWLAVDREGEMMRRDRDFKGQCFFFFSLLVSN